MTIINLHLISKSLPAFAPLPATMNTLANQIKKQRINSPSKTHFFKLNDTVSVCTFIFLLSSAVFLCFCTRNLSNFADYTDRHYIFLLCNGILAILIMNFHSTDVSSLKEDHLVVAYEIKHQPLILTPTIEQVSVSEEQDEEYDDEIERNGNRVCVTCYHDDVSIVEDGLVVVEDHETGESKEEAETEELNNRCAQFIRQMRERMKLESSSELNNLVLMQKL
ncbi:hypothetical protein HanRHA438_Chr03g0125131 [Helianthus annuus]|uniref:Transmembrane protein n=1 Tax=Helianthus annuus TaxID=4232 RepID=A0A9K3NX56_HELAN|nr:uncharacterized protein LOC110927962 [Helianthus annuus]KAF5814628.1 hypothetical protein HanXRQr2_Chr03g0113231 [Helianthus annuus]KAJ0935934.1 hypothetical protein HanRHA438_Chr03g0125131 [Helianthus annuus]KAJ0943862.1 hypothetical protein HanPSC8_Chr03g0109611 [Helianthus annuus]